MTIAKKLEELGIVLPEPISPRGLYVPWVISGSLLFLSGTGGLSEGLPIPESDDTTVSEGRVGA
jgi:enamine deaminase RidA (YjgF/YER057c/UK114 family)